MKADVSQWRSNYLQYLKNEYGELLVPRPPDASLVPEYPGEVVYTDYIKMGVSRSGCEHVIMHLDKFSRAVQLLPVDVATAIWAMRATVTWAARFGLSKWLISDGGSHFKNSGGEESNPLAVLSLKCTRRRRRRQAQRAGGPRPSTSP